MATKMALKTGHSRLAGGQEREVAVGAREDRETKSGHRCGIFRKWGRPSGQVWTPVRNIPQLGSAYLDGSKNDRLETAAAVGSDGVLKIFLASAPT